MPVDDVTALRRDLDQFRKDVNARLDTIHTAVLTLAGRAYVPGPSIWKRLGVFLGIVKLG